jgi:SAM-dependent methyltransferase
MLESEETYNTHYFDALAVDYDRVMSLSTRNDWVRDAFRQLVTDTVSRGSLLLDFGCGTGTDALWYAENGYRVVAYDSSRRMMARMEAKCANAIVRGDVVPCHADYETFLKCELRPKPIAVVSNFAVLSVIADLPALFRALARHLDSPGYVIASVANPLFWRDILRKWWWRSIIQPAERGSILRSGGGVSVRRHFTGSIIAAARPYFTRVNLAGVGGMTRTNVSHSWSAPEYFAERLERRLWTRFPFRSFGQFIFLVFQRIESRTR